MDVITGSYEWTVIGISRADLRLGKRTYVDRPENTRLVAVLIRRRETNSTLNEHVLAVPANSYSVYNTYSRSPCLFPDQNSVRSYPEQGEVSNLRPDPDSLHCAPGVVSFPVYMPITVRTTSTCTRPVSTNAR